MSRFWLTCARPQEADYIHLSGNPRFIPENFPGGNINAASFTPHVALHACDQIVREPSSGWRHPVEDHPGLHHPARQPRTVREQRRAAPAGPEAVGRRRPRRPGEGGAGTPIQ